MADYRKMAKKECHCFDKHYWCTIHQLCFVKGHVMKTGGTVLLSVVF